MEGYKQPPKKDNVRIEPGIWSRPPVKFGFAFVLGIFMGFLAFSLLKIDFSNTAKTGEMTGTFLDNRSTGDMKTADVLQFDSPVAKASFNVMYSPKMVTIAVDISSTEKVKALIQFNMANFYVLNLQNVSVNEESNGSFGGNTVRMDCTGDNKYVVYLANRTTFPNTIDVKIFLNDSPIYQNAVQVNKE